MEEYVDLISNLRHSDAADFAKSFYKTEPVLKKALLLVTGLEDAYFAGRVLQPRGSRATQDLRASYDLISGQLRSLATEYPSILGMSLSYYCAVRSGLVLVYRDIASAGIALVEYIPKLRSLATLATGLRPPDSGKDSAQARLHRLVQLEIDFLLAIHQSLREVNRLQYPACVVHLSVAKTKFQQLSEIADRVNKKKRTWKLLQYLATLRTSIHGKVTLVFLDALQRPVVAAAPEVDLSASLNTMTGSTNMLDERQKRDCSAEPANDFERIHSAIDAAGLAALWPSGRAPRRTAFSRAKEGDAELTHNILRAVDELLEDLSAKCECKPSLHVFYNAAAHGFTLPLNLSNHRVPLPRYLPCGSKDLPNAETLVGMRGFPCILSYADRRRATCPADVATLLTGLPLSDAGRVALLPCEVFSERLSYQSVNRRRQVKLHQAKQRAKRLAAMAPAKTDPQPKPSNLGALQKGKEDQEDPLSATRRRKTPLGYNNNVSAENLSSLAGNSSIADLSCTSVNPGSTADDDEQQRKPKEAKALVPGPIDPREWMDPGDNDGDLMSDPVIELSSPTNGSHHSPPPSPIAIDAMPVSQGVSPSDATADCAVAAIRIDLLLYVCIVLRGSPSNADISTCSAWLQRLAECMAGGNIAHLTAPVKEIKHA
ncbi:hypothetical protein DIPPA_16584 [Diplonema papillatum]|nr:hypothetical protein DIPPA_16584 [Diplonema papillatum]